MTKEKGYVIFDLAFISTVSIFFVRVLTMAASNGAHEIRPHLTAPYVTSRLSVNNNDINCFVLVLFVQVLFVINITKGYAKEVRL